MILANDLMKELFSQYTHRYERLKELTQPQQFPRSLKLFNIRLRLAFDILIDFKGEVSLTKTKQVRETYVLIIKLMEMWNAYEALSHYIREIKKYGIKQKIVKSKIYTQAFLNKTGSLKLLKETLDELKSDYSKDLKLKSDFSQYIKRVNDDTRIGKTLTDDSKSILGYFNNEKMISGIEIISLIYAERNMYYHNGETAKMGMSYKNRQKLINHYYKCLSMLTLMLINFVIEEELSLKKTKKCQE